MFLSQVSGEALVALVNGHANCLRAYMFVSEATCTVILRPRRLSLAAIANTSSAPVGRVGAIVQYPFNLCCVMYVSYINLC